MDGKIVFKGSLEFMSLADVFQVLGGNNSTGELSLRTRYAPNVGIIYFLNGNPVNSSLDNLTGLEALHSFFGWKEGEFEFNEKKIEVDQEIRKNRMEIILDAFQLIDNGVIKTIGSANPHNVIPFPSIDSNEDRRFPIIKGSAVDYGYVIREEIYDAGVQIVNQGGFGKWIWVILEGTVRVVKQTDKGSFTVARLGQGSFIGTLKAIFYGDHSRSASVIAETDIRLGLLDLNRLYWEYEKLSPDFRNLLRSLDKRLIRITDRASACFHNEIESIDPPKPNSWLMEEGDGQTDLFVMEKGRSFVLGKHQIGGTPLFALDEHDIFGYIPFMDIGHEPEAASIAAMGDVSCRKIDSEKIHMEYNRLSKTFRNLIYNLSGSISMTTNFVYSMEKERIQAGLRPN